MGNSQGFNVIWYLDRENRYYLAGEHIKGYAYINNKMITMLRKTVFVSYGIRITHNKSTIQPSSNRSWLYSKTNVKTALTSSEPEGKDLDIYTVKVNIDIKIPNDVPPSIFDSNGAALVVHVLQLSPNGRLYKALDDSRSIVVCVNPKVNITSFFNDNTVESISSIDKPVIINLKFNKNRIILGDHVSIYYEIINDKEYLLNSLQLEMIQMYRVEDNSGEKVVFIANATSVQKTNEKYLSGKINFSFPNNDLPPTTNFVGGINKQFYISLRYAIRATLSIKSIIRNNEIEVEAPIFVGNHSDTHVVESTELPNQNHKQTRSIGFSELYSHEEDDNSHDKHSSKNGSIVHRSSVNYSTTIDDGRESTIGWNVDKSIFNEPNLKTSKDLYIDIDRKNASRYNGKGEKFSKITGISRATSIISKKFSHGINFLKDVVYDNSGNEETFIAHEDSQVTQLPVENQYSSIQYETSDKLKDIIDGKSENL
ncbi:hypothetical protein GJ496_003898 [Pomphorhynchus laevis]|nr:hypothetical protein GJ496_003898 [Pomphorhynchus laevis]